MSSSLLLRPKKQSEPDSASFGYDDLSSVKPSFATPSASGPAPLASERLISHSNEAGSGPNADSGAVDVAAKWDSNPLRNLSRKKSSIIS